MATLNNLFRKLLNVNTAVFNNMRIETDQDGVTSVTVMARVKRKESHRCPVCGKKCSGYDQGGRKVRRWRALDMCGLLYLSKLKWFKKNILLHNLLFPLRME